MLRNLDIFTKSLVGCGLAFAMFVPWASVSAKGAGTALHSSCSRGDCKKTVPAAGNEKVLYAFKGAMDGANPATSLIAEAAFFWIAKAMSLARRAAAAARKTAVWEARMVAARSSKCLRVARKPCCTHSKAAKTMEPIQYPVSFR